MLNLQSFKFKDLQNFLAILSLSKKENLNLEGLEQQINNFIETETKKYKKMESTIVEYNTKEYKICPSCTKGGLELLIVEGSYILSCRKCRYSKYMGEI